MAKVRLSGSEKRALILWVLAGIVGLWYAHRHFFEAFPEASVNFRVTREEALVRARSFVESLGQPVDGYRSVIVFGIDDDAKTYLERQVGLKEANRLMSFLQWFRPVLTAPVPDNSILQEFINPTGGLLNNLRLGPLSFQP